MDEELARLRARVDLLEKRWEHVLGLADRIDSQLGSVNALDDTFVMPALLHLGGDVLRERMLRWLEQLVEEQESIVRDEGVGQTELLRLHYWQDLLRKREPWPRFPPDGWMSPREEGDGSASPD